MTVEQIKDMLHKRADRFDKRVDDTFGEISKMYLTKYAEVTQILEIIEAMEKEEK